MNLEKYNDNFRLNGYYPHVSREGELIEYSEEFFERLENERRKRQDFLMAILGLAMISLMVFALTLVDMRDKYNITVISLTHGKDSPKDKPEIYNFRKYIGLEK